MRSDRLAEAVPKWKPDGTNGLLGKPKQMRGIDKIGRNLMEFRIQDGETVAQDESSRCVLRR